ncbi:MAG: mannose-6-phosphate isomerase, partial [Bacteroidales bacterium]|nr:mannose-6-phosphate isomerase [Bacteroidales bacterium]
DRDLVVVFVDVENLLQAGFLVEVFFQEALPAIARDRIAVRIEPGDVFFLPAGRIHAICSGCFIAEIQQTSDLTYRIYDYGRMGLDGKPRQLHIPQAQQAVDYKVYGNYRTEYEPVQDEEVELVNCPYFTTSVLDLTLPYAKDLSELDSFLTVMCLSGSGTLEVDGEEISIGQGETVLIPADADDVCFIPEDGMKLLTSYIS